jgi:hypothetical protein
MNIYQLLQDSSYPFPSRFLAFAHLTLALSAFALAHGHCASPEKIIESFDLIGLDQAAAWEMIQGRLLPGSSRADGVVTTAFRHKDSDKWISLYIDGVKRRKVSSVAWQFDGAPWTVAELARQYEALVKELYKRKWTVVSGAAMVDDVRLHGRLESIPRGKNTANYEIHMKRPDSPWMIKMLLAIPMDGKADEYVPALWVDIESTPVGSQIWIH